MKSLVLVFLVIGYSSGSGSGPYLPSGWRPSGPAFNLPTEFEKPLAAIPLKEVPVQETETSESAYLREYGPPKAQVEETVALKSQEDSGTSSSDAVSRQFSQDLSQQALPDPVTEQAFVVIEAKFTQDETNAEVVQEATTELLTSDIETTIATETQTAELEATKSGALVELKTDIETQTESALAIEEETTTAAVTDKTQNNAEEKTEIIKDAEVTNIETSNGKSNIIAAVEEKREEVETAEGVKNIAEALVNLEKEIKAEQVQANKKVTELRTVTIQESTGSIQNAPEGFLEYGPPGFSEYGPPKGDLKTVLTVTEEKQPITSNEINEARRRRFSPKFRH